MGEREGVGVKEESRQAELLAEGAVQATLAVGGVSNDLVGRVVEVAPDLMPSRSVG